MIPENVKLIDPQEEVSSYAIGELADIVMVYSSTLGLEFALRGIKPWVAAKTYYSGKGFTVDLVSQEDLYNKLDEKRFRLKLSDSERAYAERFAYMIRFRYFFSFPFFKKNSFDFKKYKACLREGHSVVENICDMVEGKRDCLDLGMVTSEAVELFSVKCHNR